MKKRKNCEHAKIQSRFEKKTRQACMAERERWEVERKRGRKGLQRIERGGGVQAGRGWKKGTVAVG